MMISNFLWWSCVSSTNSEKRRWFSANFPQDNEWQWQTGKDLTDKSQQLSHLHNGRTAKSDVAGLRLLHRYWGEETMLRSRLQERLTSQEQNLKTCLCWRSMTSIQAEYLSPFPKSPSPKLLSLSLELHSTDGHRHCRSCPWFNVYYSLHMWERQAYKVLS